MDSDYSAVIHGFNLLMDYAGTGRPEFIDLVGTALQYLENFEQLELPELTQMAISLLRRGSEFSLIPTVFPLMIRIWELVSPEIHWLTWLLAQGEIPLTTLYQLGDYVGENVTPLNIFVEIMEYYGDAPEIAERLLDFIDPNSLSREDYTELMEIAQEFPRTRELFASRLIATGDFRPIPSWVRLENRPLEVTSEEDFFQVYGPRNWPDELNPLDGRMLIFNDTDQGWFRGYCQSCLEKIRAAEHAIRIPEKSRGWKGCFCSFACILNWLINSDQMDVLIASRLANLCQEINQRGIFAPVLDPEPARAQNECFQLKQFLLDQLQKS